MEKDTEGILISKAASENLLASFGGINQNLGMPVFEFYNSIKDINCDKIFLRDFHQSWYQKGVDDNINNIDKLIVFLSNETNTYKKVCFLGNSMGGYAALLFGNILKVNKILAFAPQTFIDKTNRLLNLDFRWKKELKNVFDSSYKRSEFFDLKKYFISTKNQFKNAEIFYCPSHRLDRVHAERLKMLPNVSLRMIKEGNHAIVKTLRDNGELKKIILKSFMQSGE
jgi:hypothetical protein